VNRDSPPSAQAAADPVAQEAGQDPPKRGAMRFRRANSPRLDSDSVRRQGEITRLAFHLLGRDGAIDFLNNEHAELGARPLDLATASAAGCATVEAALGRLTVRQGGDS
jgi:uncharacterized protein (DUF2384 family)